ncbi:hypothetical protein M408DRAFT_226359 [Serendipita vermifera MAFF 305830]|uniref:Uncharacterized protein n=1 Tax=Serendipita vermifera MAFF 305830 TaxID=933852 RepID=A0A0C3AYE8_SERVB|nr:hypothetical protein M408DRAFT_226359 [Serendipita vermifera MAFF 305830]
MRPRRAIQRTSYRERSDSDSEGSTSVSSTSDLTELGIDDEVHYPVVHLLTASEVVETENLILVEAEELAVVDARYRELKLKLDSTERERNAKRDRLFGLKARLTRIRALPQEVLGYIFLFYMDEPAHSPWTLMQVTRTWRATALSTRALWTKIMITSPVWQKRGGSRWKAGREVCGSMEQLDRALRRAGNEPLDVEIALKVPSGYRYRSYTGKAIADMINHLASTQRHLRVEHLHVHGEEYYGVFSKLSSSTSMFPKLRTLRLPSSCCDKFVAKISPSFQHLTELCVYLRKYWDQSANLPLYEIIGQWVQTQTLASLSLITATSLERLSFQPLYSVLQKATFITTLDLTNITFQGISGDPAPLLSFPNLHTLVLKDGFKDWAFDTPCLKTLTMTMDSAIPRGPPGSNHFPLLASMTILHTWSTDYIKHIHFPPLHTLDISSARSSYGPGAMMNRSVDLNPVVFRLRKTKVSTSTLVAWLALMDRLEELVLVEIDVDRGLFDFLASSAKGESLMRLSMTGENELNCPRLVRLQVDLKAQAPVRNRTTIAVAKKTSNARIKAGIAIERWAVCSPTDRSG